MYNNNRGTVGSSGASSSPSVSSGAATSSGTPLSFRAPNRTMSSGKKKPMYYKNAGGNSAMSSKNNNNKSIPMMMRRQPAQQQQFNNKFNLWTRRGNAGGSPYTMTTKHFWLGGSMLFCLVLVYLAAVIAVTQMHDWGGKGGVSPSSLPLDDMKSLSHLQQKSKLAAEQYQEQQFQLEQQLHQQKQAAIEPLKEVITEKDIVAEENKEMKESNNEVKLESVKEDVSVEEQKTEEDKEKEEIRRQREAERKRKSNLFRQYDLSATLDKGIQPEKFLHADDESKHELAIKAAALENFDPPLDKHPTPDHVVTAYMEPIEFDEWEVQPLPERIHSTAQAAKLQKVSYTRVNSCQRLTQQWPIDDTPSEQDPFLPWIHDVFPTADGKYVQFVAQNRRRCRTGKKSRNETDIMLRMQPQVALFQHVSVRRLNSSDDSQRNEQPQQSRYRLSNHDEADADGIATRFICRFKPSMEETLSEFNFDYDWTAYRKRYKQTFAKFDGGIKSIHTSQLLFKCPVPDHLQEQIRTGAGVQNDWATLFVDLIPIRTPPRYGTPVQYLQPRYTEFTSKDPNITFDPMKAWGRAHVLPAIEDSGRWENIPICLPSLMQYENQTKTDVPAQPQERQVKHRLVSCIWASAGYNTRGNRFAINDGQRRLLEWISYNKVIGFDHFYLYDNSGAFADSSTSLKAIADLFPDDITYIAWPSQICNNRPNNVDSPGERSSQYAAEASCRLRFGPHVEWIGQFDIDEYLVPMGKHETVTSLLDELDKEDTRIISFGSWRAWPRRAFVNEIVPINDANICWHNEPCFDLTIPNNVTMLQAYNCDRQPPGKKNEVMPAEKQLYRTDYVTHHFIHYSAVTKLSEKNKTEYEAEGFRWRPRAFPDPRQRFGKEETEALMLHTKAVAIQDTAGYERMCSIKNLELPVRKQGLCRLGVPWPDGQWPEDTHNPPHLGTPEGYAYNCFVNPQIEKLLVPRLEKELQKHLLSASS